MFVCKTVLDPQRFWCGEDICLWMWYGQISVLWTTNGIFREYLTKNKLISDLWMPSTQFQQKVSYLHTWTQNYINLIKCNFNLIALILLAITMMLTLNHYLFSCKFSRQNHFECFVLQTTTSQQERPCRKELTMETSLKMLSFQETCMEQGKYLHLCMNASTYFTSLWKQP